VTKQELDAIRERCAKATPGPWELRPYYIGNREAWTDIVGNIKPLKGTFTPICKVINEFARDNENKQFITNARTDIPILLAEIDRLNSYLGQVEIDHLEQEVKIDSLRAELNSANNSNLCVDEEMRRITIERDALEEDMRKWCVLCKHCKLSVAGFPTCEKDANGKSNHQICWEWRGLRKEKE
jgi:hypothetical protein